MAVMAAALTAIASRWELALPANAEIVESPSSLPEPKTVPLLLTPRRRESLENQRAARGLAAQPEDAHQPIGAAWRG